MRLYAGILCAICALNTIAADVNYQNDFEKTETGSVPKDMLVLDGAFAVKEENGNKVLELPGSPLDTFGILFGPSAKENFTVTARILGTAKGRRYPAFDVGSNGVGGYRLRVSAGKKQLELLRNDIVKANVPFEWTSGKWTFLKLTVKQNAGKWSVSGKVWQEGGVEPSQPSITFEDAEAPPAGRASVFGMPYSGAPIHFDDVAMSSAK